MTEEMIKQIKKLLFDYTEVYDDVPIFQELELLIKDNYISKDKIKQRIKILENINDSLKFVENRGYEPETYIVNSNKYIINFLNKLLEGGTK